MIVVDTNILAYLLIEGENTFLARRVWEADRDWRLPSLWRHEFLNVLATYGRHGGAEEAALIALWRRALDLWWGLEVANEPEFALSQALELNISGYDAQFVALAVTLDVPLVTEDRRLRSAVPAVALSMQQFLTER